MSLDRHWDVFDGDALVLTISSVPGAIVSTAHLAPGQSARQCAFMSATSRSPEHEHRFHQFLEESSNIDQFIAKLLAAGLSVESR